MVWADMAQDIMDKEEFNLELGEDTQVDIPQMLILEFMVVDMVMEVDIHNGVIIILQITEVILGKIINMIIIIIVILVMMVNILISIIIQEDNCQVIVIKDVIKVLDMVIQVH